MEEKIRNYVEKIASEKGAEIDNDTDLFATGIIDSMGIIFLLTYIQEEFGVVFINEEVNFENYQTVNSIISWLKKTIK